jgi:CRP-like cAMP-binding protein
MAESSLERQLSTSIMRGGAKPRTRTLAQGSTLVEQGQAGSEMYLLLDGMLAVEVDGVRVGDVGPGAVIGERALLEGGLRTSTLRALTPCRLAIAQQEQVERAALEELSTWHRREDA